MNKNPLENFPRRNRPFIFLTGATGLVGNYLLRDLFAQGHQLAVLVRSNKKQTGQQRIEVAMQRWEKLLKRPLPRPIVFEGDVTRANLGLSKNDFDWITGHCDQIIHSAAVLQFHGATRAHEPWRTNLSGTQHVLDFCRQTEIKNFHYVSTAYVCGKRSDPILETDLDYGQEFRNDYERSKFAAEQLVRSADHLKSTTIFRPAVIVGDSQTGYTCTYHGLFLYLRLIATLVPQQRRNAQGIIETPIRIPIDGDEPRNLVPVDWVAAVISHVVSTPEAHGNTFHLSPDHFVTARNVIEYCYEYFNSTGVEFCGAQAARVADNDFAQRLFENVSIYESYETSDPTFDNRNVKRWAGHLKCPIIDKAMILRFLEFGKANRWGKLRKQPASKTESNMAAELTPTR